MWMRRSGRRLGEVELDFLASFAVQNFLLWNYSTSNRFGVSGQVSLSLTRGRLDECASIFVAFKA